MFGNLIQFECLAAARHFNRKAVVNDAKLLSSAKVVGDFGTVDNVLARQTRDIGARASDVVPIDNCDALSFASKSQAAIVEPVPPPRISRSNSSGGEFLRAWADEQVSRLLMRLFLSERQTQPWLALI